MTLKNAPISNELGNLLQQYNSNLDIVYQDSLGFGSTQEYKSIIFSNNSTLVSPTSAKPKEDAFSNPNFIVVLVIISATLVVAVGSKFYLRQTLSKSKK